MGRLKLLDKRAVVVLADEVRCNETGRPVDLGNFVGEHVAIVVVGRHTEATASPSDNLHRCSVRNQMWQITTALVKKPGRKELNLVMLVKGRLHSGPEPFLPLENCLLGDDIRRNLGVQATLEEDVGQVNNVVKGIVIRNYGRFSVVENSGIKNGLLSIDSSENGFHSSLSNIFPTSLIFASDSVALEKNWLLESKQVLKTFDVDGVAADGNSVPPSTHRAIGADQCLLETHLSPLNFSRRNCRLLENSTDPLARGDGVLEDLVVSLVARLAREVVVLPLRRVHMRPHPLLKHQLHAVLGHLLSGDVHHRRCDDLG
mmetsp:Transcript_18299/g.50451  ORF Transcript_18299/g.50451 Transcript_18299/m.50451 type:complete len:316 (-) Transcript_18299:55-1002(-)